MEPYPKTAFTLIIIYDDYEAARSVETYSCCTYLDINEADTALLSNGLGQEGLASARHAIQK